MTETKESKHDSLTMVAAGLLVLIIVLLGVLWYRERQGRLAAERRAAAMAALGAGGGQAGAVNEILAEMLQKQAGAVQPFSRADLERTRELVVDGRPRQALVVSAAAGQRLGFLPGDVVMVEKSPTTAPASAAATREAKGSSRNP
ncbi:MAG: hypothetical protein LLG01_06850 [Planctomycetaceae bacterium]|nr:hypothetical protein [Planctomycetaceae bacterium]